MRTFLPISCFAVVAINRNLCLCMRSCASHTILTENSLLVLRFDCVAVNAEVYFVFLEFLFNTKLSNINEIWCFVHFIDGRICSMEKILWKFFIRIIVYRRKKVFTKQICMMVQSNWVLTVNLVCRGIEQLAIPIHCQLNTHWPTAKCDIWIQSYFTCHWSYFCDDFNVWIPLNDNTMNETLKYARICFIYICLLFYWRRKQR